MKRPPTVFVGLSGGVDSAVSALLMKEQGFRVEGLFMKNWEEDDTSEYCSAKEDLESVKSVCKRLSIPLNTVNFSQEYWKDVFQYFLDEYNAGRTPNPDILCNKEIKFKAFLDYARKLGADSIATGHYVQKNAEKPFSLLKGVDNNKDQSYFLYTLSQAQLEHSLFPIGHLEKSAVRQLAKDAGLSNHSRKDSTGICFIGERRFKTFLQDYIPHSPGDILTPEGEKVGTHDGIMYYTLGQRSGLRIGGRKGALDKPWYVVGKQIKENILYVTQHQDHPWHNCSRAILKDPHWINTPPAFPYRCHAKTRYRQSDIPCTLDLIHNTVVALFDTPQRAVTPGQSLVVYNQKQCLGGGVIEKTDSPGGLNLHTSDRSFYAA